MSLPSWVLPKKNMEVETGANTIPFSNSNNKIINYTFNNLIYILSFIIPMIILPITNYICTLDALSKSFYPVALLHIPLISCSSLAFAFYLINRKFGTKGSKYDFSTLLYALCYGLSSYALVQPETPINLLSFVIFPIIIYGFELLYENGKSFILFLFLTASFFISLMNTYSLLLFLCLYFFLLRKETLQVYITKFLRFLLITLLAFACSGFITIPRFVSLYKEEIAISKFQVLTWINDFPTLLSRLVAGSSPSYTLFYTDGVDIYCGLLILFFCIMFFFRKDISIKRKLYTASIFVILGLALAASNFSYFFHMFTYNMNPLTCYSYLFVFIILITSFESFYKLKSFSLIKIIMGFAVMFAISLISMNFADPMPVANSIIIGIDIIIVFAIMGILYRLSSIKKKICYMFFILISIIELSINCFTVSYELTQLENDTIEYNASTSSKEAPEENLAETLDKTQTTHTFEISMLFDSLSPKYAYVVPTTDWASITESTPYFEKVNSLASMLGSKQPLFTDADLTISFRENENLRVCSYGNNFYGINTITTENSADLLNYIQKIDISTSQPGNLYVKTSKISNLGMVESNEVKTICFAVHKRENYTNNVWVTGAFYHEDAYEELKNILDANKFELTSSPSQNFDFKLNCKEPSTLITGIQYDDAYKITCNNEKLNTKKTWQGYLAIDVPSGTNQIEVRFSNLPLYIGLAFTIFGIFVALCLYFNSDKEKIYVSLRRLENSIKNAKFLDTFVVSIKDNYVYWLSFFIPFILLIIIMIYNSFAPFGEKTIFESDGPALLLPALNQFYDHLASGSLLYSWNGGYGFSLFTLAPNIIIHAWLLLFGKANIHSAYAIFLIIRIAACSTTLVYYLTHRLYGKKAYKRDYRLLIIGLSYSLSTYMITMRNNGSWNEVFFLLPLIILGMDYLIIKKKYLLYLCTLALSLFINFYICIFICIYLVLRFFMYNHKTFPDFIKNGLRFACFSLLAAGINFIVLLPQLTFSQQSNYLESDSVFPSISLLGSFADVFQKQMVLSNPVVISRVENDVNLYAGILCILLSTIYFLSKQIPKKERFKNFILYFLLFVSYNEAVLNYIWNGFHYQSGVPNRFAFLQVILICTIAYDALINLKKISTKTIAFASIILSIVWSVSFKMAQIPNSLISFIASIILVYIYFFILVKLKKANHHKKYLLNTLLVSLCVIELSVNAVFLFTNLDDGAYNAINAFQSDYDMVKDLSNSSDDFIRTSYPASFLNNSHLYNGTVGSSVFFSYVSPSNTSLSSMLGYRPLTNAIMEDHTSTPFSNMLSATKYISVGTTSSKPNLDLNSYYKPISESANGFIFENDMILPVAFKVSNNFNIDGSSYDAVIDIYNAFANDIADIHSLFTSQIIEQKSASTKTDYYELIESPEFSTPEDSTWNPFAKDNESSEKTADNESSLIKVTVTPAQDGPVYLRDNSFVYLGMGEKGKEFTSYAYLSDDYDNKLRAPSEIKFQVVTMDLDKCNKFYNVASQQSLNVTDFADGSITGTTNFTEEGLLLYTVPFNDDFTAYIDGEEVPIINALGCMVSVQVPAGNHTVHIEYFPSTLIPGLIGSMISLLILFAIIFFDRKLKKKEKH